LLTTFYLDDRPEDNSLTMEAKYQIVLRKKPLQKLISEELTSRQIRHTALTIEAKINIHSTTLSVLQEVLLIVQKLRLEFPSYDLEEVPDTFRIDNPSRPILLCYFNERCDKKLAKKVKPITRTDGRGKGKDTDRDILLSPLVHGNACTPLAPRRVSGLAGCTTATSAQ